MNIDTYGIDPTYLITGISSNIKEFNLEYYVANSTKEQRNQFFDRVLAYVSKALCKACLGEEEFKMSVLKNAAMLCRKKYIKKDIDNLKQDKKHKFFTI